MGKTTLYKRDRRGAVLVWTIEWDGESYWTTSGQVGGGMTTTAKTHCHPKNVGRANETSVEAQVESEVRSKVNKQRDVGYGDDPEAPERFEVSLANKYQDRRDKGLEDFPYIVNPKLDGIRCYMRREDGRVVMRSRKHKEFVSCPHIAEDPDVIALFEDNPDLTLDGELYNHELKDDFNRICSIIAKKKPTGGDLAESRKFIRFNCFDCLFGDEPELPYNERNTRLAGMCRGFGGEVLCFVSSAGITGPEGYRNVFVDSDAEVEAYIERYVGQGFEGVMLKKDVPYIFGRSNDLLKYKRFKDAEYEIAGFEEGKGNMAGHAATVVCVDSRGVKFKAGVAGDREYTKYLLDNPDEFIGRKCTVKYQELTPETERGGGVPRFGKMTAIRNYE